MVKKSLKKLKKKEKRVISMDLLPDNLMAVESAVTNVCCVKKRIHLQQMILPTTKKRDVLITN